MEGRLLGVSFLIVAAACGMIVCGSIKGRLLVGCGFGLLASAAGLAASAQWDLPTGASVVTAFGLLFTCCTGVYATIRLLRFC